MSELKFSKQKTVEFRNIPLLFHNKNDWMGILELNAILKINYKLIKNMATQLTKKEEGQLYTILAQLKCKNLSEFYLENALKEINKKKFGIPLTQKMRAYVIKNEMFIFGLS